ncbi:M15 family metallopeptidase [Pedobacter sp. UBA5917]|jgi:peptidoglycan L-alanyl-D-glutamate endopeptidase CwlK|uniref:M15 family metallopeptidase n=1 Tax=Pedobacter sp. UBA5917 TaxID=1947061 RepID=UPI0025F5A01E|nr:M15 family metallopeptidase [Pedobacter sp. UBA5917]
MDKSSQTRIQLLHPDLRELATSTFSQAEAKLTGRAKPRITATLRTFKEQQDLYNLGRTVVNPDGRSGSKPMGNIVTNAKAGQSIHNYGLALDFVLIIDGKDTSWNMVKDYDQDGRSDWMEVVNVFKTNGWEWGGDWVSFKDGPHLQYDYGYTWQQLQVKMIAGEQRNGYVILDREPVVVPNLYRTTTALNFRTGPSVASEKIKKIPVILKGEHVAEISRDGEWSLVNYEDIQGYVNNKYLSK